MLQKLKNKSEGFTIIEVLIVLAIAGLIILIVFLAVPALQRNSRNTQRQNDASGIVSSVNECLTNKNGVSSACDTIAATEIPIEPTKISQLKANDGTTSNITVCGALGGVACGGFTPANGTAAWSPTAQIRYGAKCTNTGDNVEAGTARQFAFVYQVENAQGRGVTRCLDA